MGSLASLGHPESDLFQRGPRSVVRLRNLFRRYKGHRSALLAVARCQGWIPSNMGTNPPHPPAMDRD
jgi:hypothetical protein